MAISWKETIWRYRRRILLFLGTFFVLSLFACPVSAAQDNQAELTQEYYEEQLELSGANDLPYELPEGTMDILSDMGIDGVNWEQISNVTPQGVFYQVLTLFGVEADAPLKAAVSILTVMILCAMLNSMRLSFGEQPVGGVVNLVGTLCVCTVMVEPVVRCIVRAADVIQGASNFMLACIPVLVGILVAGGQAVSASSFQFFMFGAGNVISFVSAHFIVPVLNIFLGFSLVSSLSPNLNLNGLCKTFTTIMKWVLGFSMSIFTGLLTMQSLLGNAVDVSTNKTVKFVVSSFVPVVGSALGDAFGTVQGSVKLLKSGVGAFGLLAIGFIFFPVLAQCLLWQVTVIVCASIADVFDLKEIAGLLRAISKVISLLIAILLCSIAVLIISTIVMMAIGGGIA